MCPRLLHPAAPAPLARQSPPLAHPPHTRPVGITLVSHRTAHPSVAIAAATIATAAPSLATIPAATAAVTISCRIVVTRIAAPSAAVRLATLYSP